jgi:hypothetical protein
LLVKKRLKKEREGKGRNIQQINENKADTSVRAVKGKGT